ncbi:MAG: HDOD domain-containing protein [Rhodocyclaceae bacterium]|nr:HDOD domain-containing protein [Rhodocyclaceae bacterium]
MPTSQLLPQRIAAAVESTLVPPLPQILLRLLEAVEDDGVSIATLSELIGRDPVLAARVLAAANSAAFRRGTKAVRIEDCVKILGTRIVRAMATCLAVQHTFDPLSRQLRADLTDFWRHSMLVAETARALAVEAHIPRAEEAYLAGLLHDLGELMLLVGVPEYAGLLAICPDEATLSGLERQAFGTDHAAVGAWLADQWKLDSLLADAILFHHHTETEIAAADSLSRLLWVAHTWIATGELPPTTEAMIGIAAADLASPLTQARERVEKIAAALGLAETPGDTGPKRPFPAVAANASGPAPEAGTDPGLDAAVRDRALMQPLQRSLFALESDAEILFSLRESVRILFGLGQLAFFNFDPVTATFSGAADGTQPALLRQLKIPLEPANSLVALAAKRGEPCASSEQEGCGPSSLADIQLMRGLGADRLICVPMRTSKQLVGVMAFGLSQTQFARMGKRIDWLTSFARLGASTLEAWREAKEHESRIEGVVVGRFEQRARRVVHEVGNPLGIIRNYLALLERKLPDNSPLHDELAIVGEEIDRVARIVERMGEPPTGADDADLNALVREMMSFYDSALFAPRGIAVELPLAAGKVRFAGDRDTVKQILLNLCKNASEAMNGGGCLTIATSLDVFEGGRQYVELHVADNGPGLPAEVLQRLKGSAREQPPGRQGIGLSVVAALVARLDGKLICKTQPDEGTAFSVLIPAATMATVEEM